MLPITIITVAYNAEKEIGKTIESVLDQSFTMYEYIIIDGKSQDQTVQIANQYSKQFKKKNIMYTVFSQTDSGIYDAMNKGIEFASGKWILFMNAGDILYSSDVLHNISIELEDNCGIVYGETIVKTMYKEYVRKTSDPSVLPYDMPFCHQSVFTQRTILKEYKFSLDLKICADLLLYSLCYRDGIKFKRTNKFISIYDASGLSTINQLEATRDRFRVLEKLKVVTIEDRIIYFIRIVKIRVKDVIKQFCPDDMLSFVRRLKKY